MSKEKIVLVKDEVGIKLRKKRPDEKEIDGMKIPDKSYWSLEGDLEIK